MSQKKQQQEIRNLRDIYKRNLERQLGTKIEQKQENVSLEYVEFKQAFMPKHLSLYEKACNYSQKLFTVKLKPQRRKQIQEAITIAHLNTTPEGVASLAYIGPFVIMILGIIFSILFLNSLFFMAVFLFLGVGLIQPFGKIAEFIANNWRLKASNQMVLCVFYVVTYMRHTPNLENALEFAAQHLSPPLSLDLKKVLWDIETEKFSSIKDSLDNYLESWKKWNIEFIEAFHLIESSLYESDEGRRLTTLDKALDVILNETYEKMLHYAHNLQSPITMLHMLGIILPILGLVILPLVVSFMENVSWFSIAILYNIALPISVYFIGKVILSKRPTGYGDTDISEENPELKKYKNMVINIGSSQLVISPLIICLTLCGVLFLIGMLPILMHAVGVPDFGFGPEDNTPCLKRFCFLEYRDSETGPIGPFGLGASLFSLLIPLAFGLSAGLYFRMRSKNVIKIRERSKKLEDEFASALYQLGNRLGDNLPVEIAVERVAETMQGTISGNFFQVVSMNLRRMGMGINQAIFDPQHGALLQFPSNVIESSMKVLTQSIKKGPLIAAQALTNVSRYIKEIHRVNERLKDLMADITSSMNSQIKFLTPAIAGVVIGITSMTTAILGKLGAQFQQISQSSDSPQASAGIGIFGDGGIFGNGVPTYFFQIVVGLYVVQITYILTIMATGILNGSDKLGERYELGKNLIRSTVLYVFIAGAVMLMFNLIAGSILESTLN